MAIVNSIEDIQKNARSYWLALMLVCAYALLTLGTIVDSQVILDSSSFKLPVVGAEVRLRAFLLLTPLLLLGLHCFFHLYLQRLWWIISSANKDADADTSRDAIYAWSTVDIVNVLKPSDPPLMRRGELTSVFVAFFLGWGLVPFTLLFIWLRSIAFRMDTLTVLQSSSILLAILVSIISFRATVLTLSDGELSILWRHRINNKLLPTAALFSLIVFGLSVIVLRSDLPPGKLFKLDLEQAELAPRPSAWFSLDRRDAGYRLQFRRIGALRSSEQDPLPSPRSEQARLAMAQLRSRVEAEWRGLVVQVQAPFLQSQDLRYANLTGSFAVRTNLANSRFDHAVLVGTSLEFAKLSGSTFNGALLRQTQFYEADATVANFREATVEGANFERARLVGARFASSQIMAAIFDGAELAGTDFTNAVFVSTNSLTESAVLGQPQSTFNNTRFSNLSVSIEGTQRRIPVIFAGADLSGARLSKSQIMASCGDENTKLPPGIVEIPHCRDVIGVWPIGERDFQSYSSFLRESP
ncbi:pentapeptide repeat-containing protein [Cognatiyoonia sp. IB215182]|uniref:pentapeptide repeat-containing protein n=1 Tax=Cognatiyoonia sp. IB215182 TaxID=3097353 RepID=UPI002A0F75C8|nr:pentapeptide repeat-containing protein [Cognatiyoonia sp. IB215182]MDX8353986.1 pentapeptide repeat-containing protein [Cognatiyoonia sp. IB215182]